MTLFSGTMTMGQKLAEARMTDSCTVGEWGRTGELDEATGEYVMGFTTIAYQGPCEYNPGTRLGRPVDVVSQTLFSQYEFLKLPMSTSTHVRHGHVAWVTGSQTDPAMPGTRVTISGPFVSTYATARKFPVEAVS